MPEKFQTPASVRVPGTTAPSPFRARTDLTPLALGPSSAPMLKETVGWFVYAGGGTTMVSEGGLTSKVVPGLRKRYGSAFALRAATRPPTSGTVRPLVFWAEVTKSAMAAARVSRTVVASSGTGLADSSPVSAGSASGPLAPMPSKTPSASRSSASALRSDSAFTLPPGDSPASSEALRASCESPARMRYARSAGVSCTPEPFSGAAGAKVCQSRAGETPGTFPKWAFRCVKASTSAG